MISGVSNSEYINLDRAFRELGRPKVEDDDLEFDLSETTHKTWTWDELFQQWRVVLLAEAGAGKTWEIREAVRKLRDQDKDAFFLRLENIADQSFEDAFEGEIHKDFLSWKSSDMEAWLFLDSVDESRLKSPKDFEKAIREVGKALGEDAKRARIFLTSRASAWRPISDHRLAIENLKLGPKQEEGSQLGNEVPSAEPGFRFFTLQDLDDAQVRRFLIARNVADHDQLVTELQAAGRHVLASRPNDLEHLIELWKQCGRLGSRLELMKNTAQFRLRERDQDRADYSELDPLRAIEGAKLLAAASTLAQVQEIRIPDGLENKRGIPIEDVLINWLDCQRNTLLQRPIFDEIIYGTVRFHHRSTREYLAAEWFVDLLGRGISRRKIEQVFFTVNYGQKVVSPSLRALLPWMALQDEGVRLRILDWAPEILLEGGDPSLLPIHTRRAALDRICDQMVIGYAPQYGERNLYASFICDDMVEDVRRLLGKFDGHPRAAAFLLELVGKGDLKELWSEVKSFVLSNDFIELQKKAVEVAVMIGSSDQVQLLGKEWQNSVDEIDRDVLVKFLPSILSNGLNINWLIECFRRCRFSKINGSDSYRYAIMDFIEKLEPLQLQDLTAGINSILAVNTVGGEDGESGDGRYNWLMEAGYKALSRLIEQRDPFALTVNILSILRRFDERWFIDNWVSSGERQKLKEQVLNWGELKRALFWHAVNVSRENMRKEGKGALDRCWQVFPRELIRLQIDDFDYLLRDVENKGEPDDRLVALSALVSLSESVAQDEIWLKRIKEVVAASDALEGALCQIVSAFKDAAWKQEARRIQVEQKRRERQNDAKLKRDREANIAHFREKMSELKAEVASNPDVLQNEVCFLLQSAQAKSFSHTRRGFHEWEVLSDEYGEDVARYFRDSVANYWRYFTAPLRSEGALSNELTYGILCGLSGLEILSREQSGWLDSLTSVQVERAFRFALFEINGFPKWFTPLFERYPDNVGNSLLKEVAYEMVTEAAEQSLGYVVSNIKYSANSLREWLAPHVVGLLSKNEPKNLITLDSLVGILRTSAIDDNLIVELASQKCQDSLVPCEHKPSWFAAWIGSDAETGIRAFEEWIEARQSFSEKTDCVMNLSIRLISGKRSDGVLARKGFERPRFLKELYLLLLRYIRISEDIERANGGIYSPGIRDYAQDARASIYRMLEQSSGEEAYQCLMEIAQSDLAGSHRSWILHQAKSKAIAEGNIKPWNLANVRAFHDFLVGTPGTSKELFDVALEKLLDLKDDLENGDYSIAEMLCIPGVREVIVRNALGGKLSDTAMGRYSIAQEDERADGKRPDIQFFGNGFDGRVPVELKIASEPHWSGEKLLERLDNQLCGDYLRAPSSGYGIFLILNRSRGKQWVVDGNALDFSGIVSALQRHWEKVRTGYLHIKDVKVIGIDLTCRARTAGDEPKSTKPVGRRARKPRSNKEQSK